MVVGFDEVWIVSAAWKGDFYMRIGQSDVGSFGDESAEEGACFGDFKSVPDAPTKQAIQHTGDHGKLHVYINFHGYRRAERIDVEEVNGVADDIFNDHAACIAVDEFDR